MKIVLVFAALVAVTLASPLEQRGISEALTGVFADLQKLIKCATDAAQSSGTNIGTSLTGILNLLKPLGDILKCPASSSTDALIVLQGLITCVAQNGVGSVFSIVAGLIGAVLRVIVQLPSITPKMKIVLVFAALVAVTLASPLEQRGISEALTGVFADLQKLIKCATDAAQSSGTNIGTSLTGILNLLKPLGDILKCPASSSTDALIVLQGLITCVAQNGVGSVFSIVAGLIGAVSGLLPLVTNLGTLTTCGITNIAASIGNFFKNLFG
ncbi:hypothetical protein FQA39_LY06372 [Lamprigera yunnana]|nr:hypothetical protein FQA39_LY06372 [Lamprigera yunnana]